MRKARAIAGLSACKMRLCYRRHLPAASPSSRVRTIQRISPPDQRDVLRRLWPQQANRLTCSPDDRWA